LEGMCGRKCEEVDGGELSDLCNRGQTDVRTVMMMMIVVIYILLVKYYIALHKASISGY